MKQATRDKINALLAYLREQLNEASTIRGLISFLGVAGLLKGYSVETVFPLVLFASGVVRIFVPDKLR